MIDYSYIDIQNPWWRQKDAISQDEKILEFERLNYKYWPENILDLPIDSGAIHVINGLRQTGKSTAIKLYIRKLLKDGFEAKNIFHFNCDALSSQKDITDLLIEVDRLNPKVSQMVIFLDEISAVEGWSSAIKWLADSGLLKNKALFLTGSSSINLKKSGELMPGRRGRGQDIVFSPLSFWEYCRLVGKAPDKIDLQTPLKTQNKLREVNLEIKLLWKKFLITGGILRNINYGVTEQSNDLYLKTLKSELYKFGKKEDSLREVIRKILSSITSQTSYVNIAEEAELGSKNTAIDYLGFLSDSYFITEAKFWDIHQDKPILKKNKKFYATDPYILWLFAGFISGELDFTRLEKMIDKSQIMENFVASEIYKNISRFYFYQNSHELDFYLPHQKIGIEVKNKPKIVANDLAGLEPAKTKILVSQNTLEVREDILIVPAYLFSWIKLS